MIVGIDAQLPPVLAAWLTRESGVAAVAVRDLGLRDVKDLEIFHLVERAPDLAFAGSARLRCSAEPLSFLATPSSA